MFTVYKITNNANNKSYIGSSIRVESRWRQHINTSKNESSPRYNYPLYQAFRKYGIENFTFEILRDDFDSYEGMVDYEREMIIHYDALNHGYNQTINTNQADNCKENLKKYIESVSCRCAKVDKQEQILEIYSSYHDAARKNGYDGDKFASKIRNVCKGNISSFNNLYFRDLDKDGNVIHKDFKPYKGRKAIVGICVDNPEKEIFFDSISQCAECLGADRQSITKCIQGSERYSIVHGYIFRELDEDNNIIENDIGVNERIEEYDKRNPVIDGVRHNITEWSKLYSINPSTVNARIRMGWDSITAITTPTRKRKKE